MGYIGPAPKSGFISNAKERYTGITTAYVDLNHSISSLADVIVWWNGVKQDATNLTLTSSTRITLGATLVSADIVEVAYLGKAVSTQAPATGQVTNDMLAGSIANSKLANSSITLNGSAVSLGGSATVGGTNDNLFKAYRNGGQTLNHNTATKVQLNAESFDIDSKFDSSTNYRYTPASVGYYHLSGQLSLDANDSNLLRHFKVYCYKNGSELVRTTFRVADNLFDLMNEVYGAFSVIDYSSSTSDYYEMYAYQNNNWDTNNCDVSGGATLTYFQGYKLIT